MGLWLTIEETMVLYRKPRTFDLRSTNNYTLNKNYETSIYCRKKPYGIIPPNIEIYNNFDYRTHFFTVKNMVLWKNYGIMEKKYSTILILFYFDWLYKNNRTMLKTFCKENVNIWENAQSLYYMIIHWWNTLIKLVLKMFIILEYKEKCKRKYIRGSFQKYIDFCHYFFF